MTWLQLPENVPTPTAGVIGAETVLGHQWHSTSAETSVCHWMLVSGLEDVCQWQPALGLPHPRWAPLGN